MSYIPFEKKKKSNFEAANSGKKRRRMKKASFGGDYLILPRIKELIEMSVSPPIDEDQLLSDLLRNYPDYKRKKRGVLRAAINKAIELYNVDVDSSNEDGSIQSYVNEAEFSSDDKYVAYEDAMSPKKAKSNKRKAYVLEEETANTPDRRMKVLKNSTQETNMKDSQEKKSQNLSRSLKRQKTEGPVLQYPTVTFSDIGGQGAISMELSKILTSLKFPEVRSSLGAKIHSHGILLHGPPGCGKTFLAHAIAGELKFPLIEVAATDLISGISGESEGKIRSLFDQAVNSSPCVLFIDEVDTIASKRELASKGMEKRVVSQLLICMNDLRMKHANSQVLVIGATNTPDVLDPAFRRGGRFRQEIGIGIPDEAARISILQVISKNFRLSPDFDFHWLAARTPGYVGADLIDLIDGAVDEASERILCKLCLIFESDNEMQSKLLHLLKEAGLQVNSIREVPKELLNIEEVKLIRIRALSSMHKPKLKSVVEKLLEDCSIGVEDFEASLDTYVPSLKREGFATVCSVPWSRIGGLKKVQKLLQKAIVWPLKYKRLSAAFGYRPPSGVLLWGPKGCGKTLLARAAASECGINFMPVKGPELLNMYVGESERAVRLVFQRARNSAPCVVLFDEIDALCPPRSNSFGGNSAQIVNQLLSEIDGMGPKAHVFIVGTTNRLENIDSAMLRPGRLEKPFYVGLPTPEERVEILKVLTKNGTDPKLADDVDLEALGRDSRCEGLSGADLESLIRFASTEAMDDYLSSGVNYNDCDSDLSGVAIPLKCLDLAFNEITPSVSEKERQYFEKLKLSQERKCK